MITTLTEYREQLMEIQSYHPPRLAIMPYADTIYPINLKSREIYGPAFLSVLKDHSAQNIYFSVPRYVDYMDLAKTTCVVQYKKPDGKMGIYAVPFYDISTYNQPYEERLVFSWLLSENATAIDGEIEYSIMFFKISDDGQKFLYKLNTLPTTSRILNSLNVTSADMDGDTEISPTQYQVILDRIATLSQKDIFWLEIK